MADPQDSLLARGDFAAALRVKYPSINVPDDDDLVDAYLIKRPEFSARVSPIPLRDAAAGAGVKPRLPGDPGEILPGIPAPPPGKGGYRPDVGPEQALGMPTAPEAMMTAAATVPKGAAKFARGTATAVGRGLGVVPMGKNLDEALRPAADMLTGGMEAGAPLLVPELAGSPLATMSALAVGSAVTEGVRWMTEQMGAPPSAVELVSAAAGVISGVKVAGRVKAAGAAGAGAAAGVGAEPPGLDLPLSRGAVEAERWAGARASDSHLVAEGQMRGELADETAAVESERVQLVAAASAAKTHQDATASQSAWDYLDSAKFNHKQLTGGFAEPPPMNAEVIGRTGGEPIYARDVVEQLPPGREAIIGAPPDVALEPVGSRAPVVAQSDYNAVPEPLVTKLGGQLEEGLAQPASKPRLAPASAARSRVKIQESQAFAKRRASIVQDLSGELDNVRHAKGRQHNDVNTGETYFTPPQAGSEIYWQIVGTEKSPPTRAVIGDVVRAYAKTGAGAAKELPGLETLDLEKQYGPREFHNAYNKYVKKVAEVADKRTKAAVAREAWWDSRDAEAFKEKVAPQEQAAPLAGEAQAPLGADEPPMSAEAQAAGADDMPDFLRDLAPDASVEGAYEPGETVPLGTEAEPPLPGVEPARFEQPPVAELPEQSYSLSPPPTPEPIQKPLVENPALDRGWRPGSKNRTRLPYNSKRAAGILADVKAGGRVVTDAQGRRLVMPDGSFKTEKELTFAGMDYAMELGEYYSPEATAKRALGVKEIPAGAPTSKAGEAAAAEGRDPSFWEMLKGEEGHLVLNVKPGNARGLRDWLARHSSEHGESNWHQRAAELLEEGDTRAAYRVALLGVGEVNAGELVGAVKSAVGAAKDDKRQSGAAGTTPKPRSAIPGIPAEKIVAAAEDVIGQPLPKGTTVGAGGVLKLPDNPGGLEPKFSDLPLARSLVEDLMREVDATGVVRVEDAEGHLDQAFVSAHPEMRITAQMADQVISSMPDYVLESYHELLGLDRAQIGKHFQRAFSQAGKLLNAAKQWQDQNWDAILHLDPLTGSTAGPGAAGRLEFIDPARAKLITEYLKGERDTLNPDETSALLNDIRKLSPKQLKEIGFKLPDGAKVEGDAAQTRQARTYVSNWLRGQRQMVELGKRVDAIVEGGEIDRTILGAAMGMPEKGGARETGYALMRARLSFLISQASTAIHVFASQSAQYQLGVFEEVTNAALASARGDSEGAREYWTLAKRMQKNWGAKGSVPMGAVKHPTMDGIRDLYEMTGDILQTAAPGDVRLALKQVAEYPDIEKHLLGTLMAHQPMAGEQVHTPKNPIAKFLTSNKLGNVLTAGMRIQEAANRSAVFDAMLRTQIEMKGGDPESILRMEDGLTQTYGADEAKRMFGAATARALYMSQAGAPYPDTVPKWIIDTLSPWAKHPGVAGAVSLVVPFPKYAFGGGPRWLWDRLPGALVADMVRMKLPLPFGGKPRIQLGQERVALTAALPKLHAELGRAEYDSAKAAGDHIAARAETVQLAKEFKKLERKFGAITDQSQGQDLYDSLGRVGAEMKASAKAAADARDAHRAAEQAVKAQRAIIKETTEKVGGLEEISAPSWEQAISRQVQGGLLLAGAIALRAAQPDDTKWSQIAVGDTRVDMKWTGPFASYMLLGDVIHDVHKHTDWSEFGAAWDKAKDERAYSRVTGALKKAYSGKYTAGPLLRDATEAFLSLNGALGGTSAVIDTLLGKSESGGVLDAPIDLVLAAVGQSIGSFTFPLRQFGDVLGTVFEAESKQRLPEEAGPKGNFAKELAQPAMENVPGVRQAITPKVDPFTGAEKESPLAGMKPFTGLNPQIDPPLQKELNKTGLGYSKVAPHTTGDREFDNMVARQFGGLVRRMLPQLTENQTYQSMTPELQRNQLEKFMGKIRKAAYGLTAQELSQAGVDGPPEAQVSGGAKVREKLGTGAGQKALAQKYRKWAVERAAAEGGDEPPDAVEEPTGVEAGGPPGVF